MRQVARQWGFGRARATSLARYFHCTQLLLSSGGKSITNDRGDIVPRKKDAIINLFSRSESPRIQGLTEDITTDELRVKHEATAHLSILTQLAEMEDELTKKKAQLTEKEAQLAEKKAQLTDKEAALTIVEKQFDIVTRISMGETVPDTLFGQIFKSKGLEEQATFIDKLKGEIEGHERTMKDINLAMKDINLAMKDINLAMKDINLAMKDLRILTHLAEMEIELTKKKAQLTKKKVELTIVERQLDIVTRISVGETVPDTPFLHNFKSKGLEEQATFIDNLKGEIKDINLAMMDMRFLTHLAEMEAELTKKKAELTEIEAELRKKKAELTEKEAEVTKKKAQLTKKEAQLTEKEAQLTEKEAELTKKKAQLTMAKEPLDIVTRIFMGETVPDTPFVHNFKSKGLEEQATFIDNLKGEIEGHERTMKEINLAMKDINLAMKDINLAMKDINLAMNDINLAMTRTQDTMKDIAKERKRAQERVNFLIFLKSFGKPQQGRRTVHRLTQHPTAMCGEDRLEAVTQIVKREKAEDEDGTKERYPVYCVIAAPRQGKSRLLDEVAAKFYELSKNNDREIVLSITFNGNSTLTPLDAFS